VIVSLDQLIALAALAFLVGNVVGAFVWRR